MEILQKTIQPKHKAIADKYVGEACTLYTLYGEKPATIQGRLLKFAKIVSQDGAFCIEVSWEMVEYIMTGQSIHGKTFFAC